MFKFENVPYKTSRELRNIPENGPAISLGAICTVGTITLHFVASCNDICWVTFLQSMSLSLGYDCIDYVTEYNNIEYAGYTLT